jgi:hypothetical protein
MNAHTYTHGGEMTGETYGKFMVIDVDRSSNELTMDNGLPSHAIVTLRCEYGHTFKKRLYDVKRKTRKIKCRDCEINSKIAKEIGNSYGNLTILCLDYTKSTDVRPSWYYYMCRCDCGKELTMRLCDIKIDKACWRCI